MASGEWRGDNVLVPRAEHQKLRSAVQELSVVRNTNAYMSAEHVKVRPREGMSNGGWSLEPRERGA